MKHAVSQVPGLSALKIESKIKMSNKNIYKIIGTPKSNEHEPGSKNSIHIDPDSQGVPDAMNLCPDQKQLHGIFSKRCLYPMANELTYQSSSISNPL